jgi:N-acetylmuramic acid 6-phosphate etherase
MSIMLTGSVKERRHASTMNIDRLSTLDMLKVIHQDDAQISTAMTPCLTTIARVVDNAAATLSHGGRLVIVGAGPSGRAAKQAADEYAPGKSPVIAITAGDDAGSYERGVADLQAIGFGEHDMMLAVTVSGKTPGSGEPCGMRGRWGRLSPLLPMMHKARRRSWQAWSLRLNWGLMPLPGISIPKRGLRKK